MQVCNLIYFLRKYNLNKEVLFELDDGSNILREFTIKDLRTKDNTVIMTGKENGHPDSL
jgi:hypothetical protein